MTVMQTLIAVLLVCAVIEGCVIYRQAEKIREVEDKSAPILPVGCDTTLWDDAEIIPLGEHDQEYYDLLAAGFQYTRRKEE